MWTVVPLRAGVSVPLTGTGSPKFELAGQVRVSVEDRRRSPGGGCFRASNRANGKTKPDGIRPFLNGPSSWVHTRFSAIMSGPLSFLKIGLPSFSRLASVCALYFAIAFLIARRMLFRLFANLRPSGFSSLLNCFLLLRNASCFEIVLSMAIWPLRTSGLTRASNELKHGLSRHDGGLCETRRAPGGCLWPFFARPL